MLAAGSCLHAENRELRVLAPSGLRSDFHTRAESWRCHPEACKSLCPSPEQKPARSRAQHPTRWIPSSLFPSSDGKKRGKKLSFPRCSSGDILYRCPCPQPALPRSRRGRRGVRGAAGGSRGTFTGPSPGAAQTAPAPGRASQRRTLLGARLGNPALNQLVYSLGAPCASPPCEEDPTSDCQDVWSGGARAGAVRVRQAGNPVP